MLPHVNISIIYKICLFLKKTISIQTVDYFQQAGIAYDTVSTNQSFETNLYQPAGFQTLEIGLDSIFPDLDRSQFIIEAKVINEQKGFQWTIGIFSALAAFLFFVTFASTKERVHPMKQEKTPWLRDVKDLFANKPWIILFALGIITLFHVCLRNGTLIYYFKYNIGNVKMAPLFMLSGTLANLVSVMMVNRIQIAVGKKTGLLILLAITTLLTFAFYFIPDTQIGTLLIMHVLISFTFGPTTAFIWSMYTDAADFSEWKTGRRATGLIMSACTMAQKFGYTLGGALGMLVLARIGYQANIEQSPAVLDGIKGMISWISAIPCLTALVLVFFYPLNEEKMNRIEADLNIRRKK